MFLQLPLYKVKLNTAKYISVGGAGAGLLLKQGRFFLFPFPIIPIINKNISSDISYGMSQTYYYNRVLGSGIELLKTSKKYRLSFFIIFRRIGARNTQNDWKNCSSIRRCSRISCVFTRNQYFM